MPNEGFTVQSNGEWLSKYTSSQVNSAASKSDISSILPFNTFKFPCRRVVAEFLDLIKTSLPDKVRSISDNAVCLMDKKSIWSVSAVITSAIDST